MNDPPLGVIPESSACEAVRGAPSAGRPAGSQTDLRHPAVAAVDARLGPAELVVLGSRGRPPDVDGVARAEAGGALALIRVYAKDGQAPVTTPWRRR